MATPALTRRQLPPLVLPAAAAAAALAAAATFPAAALPVALGAWLALSVSASP